MSGTPPHDPERWRRLDELLDRAFDLDPADHPALLDEVCGDDPDLRRQAEALLAADAQAEAASASGGDLLERTAAGLLDDLIEGASDEELGVGASWIGRILGPYEVVRRVGGGGMGEVFEARDQRLGRTVALKLLPAGWSRDHEAKERFLREARAASALDHPNLCTVHDVGETDDGQLYLVMAFYGGETLADRLSRGPLEPRTARSVTRQIARGLARAHQAGIVHRDVKPANIVFTEHDEVKILDFGIAKSSHDPALTRTGATPGTPAYMSPEQAGAGPVGYATDLWSLGVVLYEMLGGRRPFVGDNPLSLLNAILHQPAPDLSSLRGDVPEDLLAIVERLLAKRPEDRYPDAEALLVDLDLGVTTASAAVTAALPTRPGARSASEHGRRGKGLVIGLAFGIVAAVALVWWLGWPKGSETTEATGAPSDVESTSDPRAGLEDVSSTKVVLAILAFDNVSRDPELDWLRRGLSDLLITDLAQSAELRVLSSRRLDRALADMETEDGSPLDLADTRGLAEATGATHLVRGSFVEAGGQLRLTFQLEDPTTGTLLDSDRFEGRGEESLFTLVDLLSAELRSALGTGQGTLGEAGVRSFTSESLAAWRAYSEAASLARRMQRDDAIAKLEEAVRLDPTFALAYNHLGTLHANQGHDRLAGEYRQRAIELADRLPLDQRYAIQGSFYGARWTTLHRAIAIWEEGLRQYPDRWSWHNNLARRYAFHERYDDALPHFEKLVSVDQPFVGNFADLANVLAAQDLFEAGERVLRTYDERHPDNWFATFVLGWHYTEWGRYEQAATAFDKAAELRSDDPMVTYGRWRLAVLRSDFDTADRLARDNASSDDSFSRWRGHVSLARNALYRGRSADALGHFADALGAYGEANAYSALVRCWIAQVHLARGAIEPALLELDQARTEGRGEWPELRANALAALAHQRAGRGDEADRQLAPLRERFRSHPNPVEERQLRHFEGLLAAERGDLDGAVEALKAAVALLPPEGVEFHFHVYPQHVPLWTDLGQVLIAAGRPAEGLPWLDHALNSGAEHLEQPIPFVRAHLLRARALEALDRENEAEQLAIAYLAHWASGDLDRDDVTWATARVTATE